jgi:hypothetical protein
MTTKKDIRAMLFALSLMTIAATEKGEKKMRDRLVELIAKSGLVLVDGGIHPDTHLAQEALADHLLAEGVIVPKVKIGDKLYAINAAQTRVNEYEVTRLEVFNCGVKIFGRPIYCREEYWLCWNQDLGNDETCVFLTRDQAERALAERSGE